MRCGAHGSESFKLSRIRFSKSDHAVSAAWISETTCHQELDRSRSILMGSLKEGAGLLDYEIQELLALAGVAQWIEHGPANRKVVGSIPSQGTCLGCGPCPQ